VPACPKCIIADLCEYPNKTPAKALNKSDAPVVRKVGPRPAPRAKSGARAKAGVQPRGSAGVKRKRVRVGKLI